jgi:hypothetical protein
VGHADLQQRAANKQQQQQQQRSLHVAHALLATSLIIHIQVLQRHLLPMHVLIDHMLQQL